MRHFKIAIDGPTGSGKSTVSKLLADKLNYTYIDTGALYRAVTYYALTKKLNLDLELSFHFLENIKLDFQNNNIFLNEYDVSKEIRINEVSNNVATVASHKHVRNKLVNIMRSLSYNHNVVMDGRDI